MPVPALGGKVDGHNETRSDPSATDRQRVRTCRGSRQDRVSADVRNTAYLGSGGVRTLGRPTCLALAQAGAKVVVNDIREAAHIIDASIEKFGAVHGIINAVLGPIPWKPFDQLTGHEIRALFEANVMRPLEIMKAAWKHFIIQRFGRIVNFTSDSMLGMPSASAYTLRKGALFGVNKTLAMEGATHNIKINCISPVAYKPAMEPAIKHFTQEYYIPLGPSIPLKIISLWCWRS